MPLCCRTAPDQLAPCYASVLAFGLDGLQVEIDRAEAAALSACATAWCGRCDRAYMLNTDAGAFPCLSAYRTHQLVLRRRLEETISPSI
jgi:hypothetical protein